MHIMVPRSRRGSIWTGKHDSPEDMECDSGCAQTCARPVSEARVGADEIHLLSHGCRGDGSDASERWSM